MLQQITWPIFFIAEHIIFLVLVHDRAIDKLTTKLSATMFCLSHLIFTHHSLCLSIIVPAASVSSATVSFVAALSASADVHFPRAREVIHTFSP